MIRIELVAGDFGTGTAWYDAGEFRLPKGRLQNVAYVTGIEVNTTVIEKHWGRALLSGAKNAAGLAPLAMVVGVFAAPIAAVGAIGIAGAAIGGAMGLMGGGAETKALVQITFEQGTGLVGICEQEAVETFRNDATLLRAHAERERRRLEPPRRGWFGPRTSTDAPTAKTAPAIAAPVADPLQADDSGVIDAISDGISSAASAASSAAATAADATGQALSGAFAFARRAVTRSEK